MPTKIKATGSMDRGNRGGLDGAKAVGVIRGGPKRAGFNTSASPSDNRMRRVAESAQRRAASLDAGSFGGGSR